MARMRPDDPDFGKWLSVLNQGPMLSSTNIFPLKNMLRSTPSAATARAATVSAGDEAPEAELVSTEGKVVRLQDFPRHAGRHATDAGGDRQDRLTTVPARSG